MERLLWVDTSEPTSPIDVNLELNSHVTISIGDRPVPSLYWQLTDPEFSLLEVGVVKQSGLLRKLSVALYRGNIGIRQAYPRSMGPYGIPVFDTREWKPVPSSTAGDYLESYGKIQIEECPNRWWIITLFDEEIVSQLSVPGLLAFGFNRRKELCQFSVNMATSYSTISSNDV